MRNTVVTLIGATEINAECVNTVELALETKAERHLVTNKADRSFCEGLLSRFAVEVGRQLAEMEQGQSSIRENLDDAGDGGGL